MNGFATLRQGCGMDGDGWVRGKGKYKQPIHGEGKWQIEGRMRRMKGGIRVKGTWPFECFDKRYLGFWNEERGIGGPDGSKKLGGEYSPEEANMSHPNDCFT